MFIILSFSHAETCETAEIYLAYFTIVVVLVSVILQSVEGIMEVQVSPLIFFAPPPSFFFFLIKLLHH